MATVEKKKDACNDMQPISSLYQFAVQKAESRFYIKSVKEFKNDNAHVEHVHIQSIGNVRSKYGPS